MVLLFCRLDGAGIPDIPCVGFGAGRQHRENKMKQLLKITAMPAAALFAVALAAMAAPTAASAGEFCRQDVTSAMRSCSFYTLEQCQAMSSGRGGDCYRDPFLGNSSYAYQPKPQAKSARRPGGNQ